MGTDMEKKSWQGRSRAIGALAVAAMVVTVLALVVAAVVPTMALADITAGGQTLHGYNPNDIISTDMQLGDGSVDGVAPMLAGKVVEIVMKALPILAVLSVGVLIYNAVRNMFLPDEDPHEAMKHGRKPKRPMGQVIKDIFMMYFWILFAWLIVELIIYAVTHLENAAIDTIGPGSSQTTTQQVQQSGQSGTAGKQGESSNQSGQSGQTEGSGQSGQSSGTATPVGGTATPVGGGSAGGAATDASAAAQQGGTEPAATGQDGAA